MSKRDDTEAMFGDLTPQEAAAKGGRASARSRRARKDFDWLREEADKLMPELVRAAKGEGIFKDLPSHQKLAALKMVFEYAYGKPGARKSKDEPDEPDEVFEIGVAPEIGAANGRVFQ